MSSATSNSITTAASVNAEFVRKGPNGLEMVKQLLGLTFHIPIKPKVELTQTGVLVGNEFDEARPILVSLPGGQVCIPETILEARPIKINWPGGETTFLVTQDGVYPNPETGDWEVWLGGEAVAWCGSQEQAERSFSEMAGEAF